MNLALNVFDGNQIVKIRSGLLITFIEYILGSVSDPKKTDTAQMRSVVTAMEELESSRQKLADNLDRNVRHEVISLYNGTDNQSCKTIKESKKSLDKIADDHEEKLLKERVPTSSLSYNLFYKRYLNCRAYLIGLARRHLCKMLCIRGCPL